MLNLDAEIQKLVSEDKLTAGHARALLSIQNKKERLSLANRISNENLSVRQTEEIVKKNLKNKDRGKLKKLKEINPVIMDIAEKLQRTLGTK